MLFEVDRGGEDVGARLFGVFEENVFFDEDGGLNVAGGRRRGPVVGDGGLELTQIEVESWHIFFKKFNLQKINWERKQKCLTKLDRRMRELNFEIPIS